MSRPKEFLAWAIEVFGPIAADRHERAVRFLEEAVELAQVEGVSEEMIRAVATRVYRRPAGYLHKEIGQALVTLEVLAENVGVCADDEAAREWRRVRQSDPEEHRQRFAAKIAIGIAGKRR
jgi:hypothetical protein